MKIINIISGIIVGLSPMLIALIFGILILNELQNYLGISIFFGLVAAAIWAGINIFKSIQNKGLIDFLTVVNTSPDLDNL